MNIFASLQVYAGKWSIKSERAFDKEEIDAVKQAVVVPSQYGNSVMFTMVAGGQTYIPLVNDSTLTVGEYVDMTEAKLLTLSKDGESDINRVSI
jgi:hypothetical protein